MCSWRGHCVPRHPQRLCTLTMLHITIIIYWKCKMDYRLIILFLKISKLCWINLKVWLKKLKYLVPSLFHHIVKLSGKSWEVRKIRSLYYIELTSLIIFSILRFKTWNSLSWQRLREGGSLSISHNIFYLHRYFN